jgi:hypothetical protein
MMTPSLDATVEDEAKNVPIRLEVSPAERNKVVTIPITYTKDGNPASVNMDEWRMNEEQLLHAIKTHYHKKPPNSFYRLIYTS